MSKKTGEAGSPMPTGMHTSPAPLQFTSAATTDAIPSPPRALVKYDMTRHALRGPFADENCAFPLAIPQDKAALNRLLPT